MQISRKHLRRAIDGVLLLDKGGVLTSNAELQRAKRLYNVAKAGHTGTLDPLATGLLPVCFGEATKFSSDLLDADKTYDAVITLGVATDTQDAEGQVLQTNPVKVDAAALEAALARFRGVIRQTPPMHSALKHQGRPLYAYAREGTEIERAPREVTIHGLKLKEFASDRVHLTVDCSKGTYIRTLAHDIGQALGCGAHLSSLRRTRVGPLTVAQAHTLEALELMGAEARDQVLLPPDSLVATLPAVTLNNEQARRFGQGQAFTLISLRPDLPQTLPDGDVRVYAAGRFLGVARTADGTLAPKRVLVSAAEAAKALE